MRILVVDDQEDVRALLRVTLDSAGHEVTQAASGAAALRALDEGPVPELVVLDVQMPDIDGWDVLQRIRDNPATADVPVLMCTVKASSADAERAWRLGCDGYLTKPFGLDALVAEVARVSGAATHDREAIRRQAVEMIQRATGALPSGAY